MYVGFQGGEWKERQCPTRGIMAVHYRTQEVLKGWTYSTMRRAQWACTLPSTALQVQEHGKVEL